MDTNGTIAIRIRELMEQRGIMQKTIAQQIGISKSTFNVWIHNGKDIPSNYVVPCAEALHVDPLWLLTGSSEYNPPINTSNNILNDEEAFLINSFRSLDREGKISVANKVVEELRIMREKTKSGSKTEITA